MARLNTKGGKKRSSVNSSQFALPGRRFPIDTMKRACAAKSYAARMYKRGQLSKSQKQKVDAKANRKLRKGSSGSRRKRSRKRRGRSRR